MNMVSINIKTEPEVKTKAQKLANDMGFSLNGLMNIWLNHLVKSENADFKTSGEIPSEYLKKMISQARKDLKEGKASPSFDDVEDAIAWLHEDR